MLVRFCKNIDLLERETIFLSAAPLCPAPPDTPEEGVKEPTDQKELARAKQEPKEGVRVTRPDWQLQLVYHLISQTSQILHFIQVNTKSRVITIL